MSRPVEWKRMTANDLRHCDSKAKEIILRAMELGAVGRLSSKGHVIVRAPNGATMSVSRNMTSSNRSRQNTEAEFARVFEGVDVPEQRNEGSLALVPVTETVAFDREPDLECPAKDCEAVFVTEGARYSHIEKEHSKCYECGYVAKNEVALRGHTAMSHSENPPWKRAAEANKGRKRGKKAELTDAGIVAAIRELLKTDEELERVPQLEAELKAARQRIAELEGKLARLKEALS